MRVDLGRTAVEFVKVQDFVAAGFGIAELELPVLLALLPAEKVLHRIAVGPANQFHIEFDRTLLVAYIPSLHSQAPHLDQPPLQRENHRRFLPHPFRYPRQSFGRVVEP